MSDKKTNSVLGSDITACRENIETAERMTGLVHRLDRNERVYNHPPSICHRDRTTYRTYVDVINPYLVKGVISRIFIKNPIICSFRSCVIMTCIIREVVLVSSDSDFHFYILIISY